MRFKCIKSDFDNDFSEGKIYNGEVYSSAYCIDEDGIYKIIDNNGKKRHLILKGFFYKFEVIY